MKKIPFKQLEVLQWMSRDYPLIRNRDARGKVFWLIAGERCTTLATALFKRKFIKWRKGSLCAELTERGKAYLKQAQRAELAAEQQERDKRATERYVSPHARPTPFQAELLDILVEECAEVIVQVEKLKRFGFSDHEPGNKDQRTNALRLAAEIADVRAMARMVELHCNIQSVSISAALVHKTSRLNKFMQTLQRNESFTTVGHLDHT